MKHKIIWLTALVVVATVASMLIFGSRPVSNPMSADAAAILSGDSYYLAYTTKWLLGDGQAVKLEDAQDGNAFLRQYEADGTMLTTITVDSKTTVFSGDELVEAWDNPESYSPPYATLTYSGKSGSIILEGHDLVYEEYRYSLEGKQRRLRCLLLNGQLWGLQFDEDDRYVQVISLAREIPEKLRLGIDGLRK